MYNKKKTILCLFIVGVVTCMSCTSNKQQQSHTSTPVASPTVSSTPTIDKLQNTKDIQSALNTLSLEEKAAQVTGSLESLVPEGETSTYVEENIKRNVEFPNNMALGTVKDVDALYQMGQYIGKEDASNGAKVSFVNVCSSLDNPMWPGASTCYSDSYEEVYTLGESYVKGLAKAGIMPCLTEFVGAGYSTAKGSAELKEEELHQQLYIYRRLLDAIASENKELPGAIQVASLKVNGVLMVENKELLTGMLRDVMKFEGVVIAKSDDIKSASGEDLSVQIATAINAGVDMVRCMEDTSTYKDAIIKAVNRGTLKEDRLNEAVMRILTTKKALGLWKKEPTKTEISDTETENIKKLAALLVEKSLVLLKNENELLPLKNGLSLYVTGPTAESTILPGLEKVANKYSYTIITDFTQAKEADITLLCLGEENEKAVDEAKQLGHPTVALLVTGRQMNLASYKDDWDAIVMCYQPGSRSDVIAKLLCGEKSFVGKLSMPWYNSETDFSADSILYGKGYGREY